MPSALRNRTHDLQSFASVALRSTVVLQLLPPSLPGFMAQLAAVPGTSVGSDPTSEN